MGAVISMQGVAKRFGARLALDSVTFEVPEGCFHGLVGPGAAGKSVLVRIAAGLIVPERGSVSVLGVDIGGLGQVELQRVRSKIGMLFQGNALFDYMTVGENVAFPLRRLTNMNEDEIRENVEERLARVGLGGFSERDPASLSGGQKKRVGIARATIVRQPLIIYDDPTAGLDPVTASRIFEILREEQETTGATVLAISSDVDSLVKYADRIAIMDRGVMHYHGPLRDAYDAADPFVGGFLRGEWRSA
ncbi:MAG: ATP-binding cassette domain-containing protein [Deltaproteobacteria bacterium]|nr:ATP-binding cassette domain-containing protein [Deltaproteobacteria bacterium]